MKRKRTIISTQAILMLAILSSALPPVTRATGSTIQPETALDATAPATSPAIESCPDLVIRITGLDVSPKTPAQRHFVRISWDTNVPQCFTADRFVIRGVLTFANNQTRPFEKTVAGNERLAQIEVPGLVNQPVPLAVSSPDPQAPKKVAVTVGGTAGAPVSGTSVPIFSSCPLPFPIELTQAVVSGLVAVPGQPGVFHPKVKVSWQVPDKPPCFSITQFNVEARLSVKGVQHTATKIVPGNETATELVLDSAAVGEGFTPDRLNAFVRALGRAAIKGESQKEISVN